MKKNRALYTKFDKKWNGMQVSSQGSLKILRQNYFLNEEFYELEKDTVQMQPESPEIEVTEIDESSERSFVASSEDESVADYDFRSEPKPRARQPSQSFQVKREPVARDVQSEAFLNLAYQRSLNSKYMKSNYAFSPPPEKALAGVYDDNLDDRESAHFFQGSIASPEQLSLQKRETSQHLHPGLLDLNQVYEDERRRELEEEELRNKQASHELAQKWLEKIGEKMVQNVDFMARKNFRNQVSKGMRLRTQDLHKLNKEWQDDYFSEILHYDDRVHKHIAKIHASVLKKRIGVRQQIDHSESLKTIWKDGIS